MRRSRWLLLAALPAVILLGMAAFVFTRVQHSLNRARATVASEGRFRFELRAIGRMENPGFEAIASSSTYTAGVFYQGKLYVSGPAGLYVYGAAQQVRGGGTALLKTYRVGVDLPAAPLGQMAVGRLRGASEAELAIATAGEGVLLFTGNGSADGGGTFRQIRPLDAGARDVAALLPLPTGELLIGTRARGLLVYRGVTDTDTLETYHPMLSGLQVTALACDATGFWVGTHDRGLRHVHAGQIDRFEAASTPGSDASNSALPDEQVDAIAVRGERIFVGTPMGVEEFDGGRPARLLADGVFAHALYADEKSIIVGSLDQGIRGFALEANPRPSANRLLREEGATEDVVEQFVAAEAADAADQLYAVTRSGVIKREASGAWTSLLPGSKDDATAAMTDGNVSALAFDDDGRLWVGYFDRGLDVIATDGRSLEHREDDRIFCVNRIVLDPRQRAMAVATANGLVLFDRRGKPRQAITRQDGLIADDVTDIAFTADTMILATPAGLSFFDAGGARSLYAFEGLVNNHVYALGVHEETHDTKVLAGTLGGISLLEHESVRQNFTTGNSGLKHNWVTAIVPSEGADAGWMIGTYGAGIMYLDNHGDLSAIEGATRAMDVNPNAMFATGAHIFAGTLGQGLWVCSRATGRWRPITAGLPSKNVTAIAEHEGQLYVGTDNGLVKIAERLLD